MIEIFIPADWTHIEFLEKRSPAEVFDVLTSDCAEYFGIVLFVDRSNDSLHARLSIAWISVPTPLLPICGFNCAKGVATLFFGL